MSRPGALLAVLLLVAMPLWVAPSALVVALSIAAGALLLLGLHRPSILATTLGGTIACGAYAFALLSAAAPAGIVEALAFGAALLLALGQADFARTFRGVDVPPAIERAAFHRWTTTVALASGGAILLIGAVSLAADGAPPVFRPVLAGLGAFLALTGAVMVLRRRRPE